MQRHIADRNYRHQAEQQINALAASGIVRLSPPIPAPPSLKPMSSVRLMVRLGGLRRRNDSNRFSKWLTLARYHQGATAFKYVADEAMAKKLSGSAESEGGDVDLDMRIKIVDGDEVIADTSLDGGFLPTCKQFEAYIQKRFKTV